MEAALRLHGTTGAELAPPFRERRRVGLCMVAGDVLVIQSIILLAIAIRKWLSEWFPISLDPAVLLGIATAALLLPLGYWMVGLCPGYGLTTVERLRKRSTVTAVAFGLMIAFDYLAQGGLWSRGVLVIAAAIALVVMPLFDGLVRHGLDRLRLWGLPVLVCGAVPRRDRVVADLLANRMLGYIPVAVAGWPPTDAELAATAASVSAVILIAPPGAVPLVSITDGLPHRRVVLVPDFGGGQSQWVSMRELGPHLGLEMRRNLLIPANMMVKRVLDLLLAAVIAILALPLIGLGAVLVKLASPGPAFYAQWREGKDGREFRLWKIRSMAVDADAKLEALLAQSEDARDEWRHHMKLRVDPRVVPGIGRFLRRWSIDELPQLWNVLRGDMSLIGPRPLPRYHLDALSPDAYHLRRKIRPGVTGLCQVSGRGAVPLPQQEVLDAYYVRNWSLWLDVYIFACTMQEIAMGRGAY